MTEILQQVLNGLQLGSVYTLIALGYTMVYGILRLINFAHGDIFMVGSYVAFFATTVLLVRVGLPTMVTFLAGMLITMVATAALAVWIERVAYKPLRNAPRVSAVITALGIGLFLENFTLAALGPDPRRMPTLFPPTNLRISGATVSTVQVAIILVSVALMVLLDTFVTRSMTGVAMRAVSFDRNVALLLGVPTDRIISITFALGSAVAGAGGILYGQAYPVIDPYMGVRIGWWAFIAAVIGGIGNIRGAMIGSFILGFLEIFTPVVLPSSTYRDFVAFSLLLVFLVFRPTGILGQPAMKKV